MSKLFLSIGAVCAGLAVMLGAFGAHGLKSQLSTDMINIFETGVKYHFYHSLGMLAVGLLAMHIPDSAYLKWAGWLMLAGILIFSGSLYILSISGIKWLGAITPIGGTAFIAAWVMLTVAVVKSNF